MKSKQQQTLFSFSRCAVNFAQRCAEGEGGDVKSRNLDQSIKVKVLSQRWSAKIYFCLEKVQFKFQGIYVLSPCFAFFDQTIALLKKAQTIKCVQSKIKIVADFSCCHDHEALHPVCESESELHAEEERGTKRTIIVALFGLKKQTQKVFPPTQIGLFSFNAKSVF